MRSPIIVIGPGFVGSNAVLQYLRDELEYNIGEEFVQPDKTMHPYPVWEDAEFHKLFQGYLACTNYNDTFGVHEDIQELVHKRDITGHWAVKTPNNFTYIFDVLRLIGSKSTGIIAGFRDPDMLIDRMMQRWDYTGQQAEARLQFYEAAVDELIYKEIPVFTYDQQSLLNEPIVKDKIKEFCNGMEVAMD